MTDTKADDRLLQRARGDCAICGKPVHKHSGGVPNTCPIIATYRPLTRLDPEVVVRVQEAMTAPAVRMISWNERGQDQQNNNGVTLRLSDVQAMLDALSAA